jgi:hypothetical protein
MQTLSHEMMLEYITITGGYVTAGKHAFRVKSIFASRIMCQSLYVLQVVGLLQARDQLLAPFLSFLYHFPRIRYLFHHSMVMRGSLFWGFQPQISDLFVAKTK